MKKDKIEFDKDLEKKYGKCKECGKQMEHLTQIHTFVCECGNRDWYAERFGDDELDELILTDEQILNELKIELEKRNYDKKFEIGVWKRGKTIFLLIEPKEPKQDFRALRNQLYKRIK